MKYKAVLASSLSLLIAACSSTQSGGSSDRINIGVGESIKYTMNFATTMTQSMGGQEMGGNTDTRGNAVLTATDRAEDRISWTLDIRDMKTTSDNPMMQTPDDPVTVPTLRFSTTPFGKLLGMEAVEGDGSQFTEMMLSMGGSTQMGNWFSPLLGGGRNVGDRWEESTTDTMNLGSVGAELRRSVTMNFLYDGVVDTLGIRAARIQVSSSDMVIEGEASVEGMDLGIDGDGTIITTNYYSLNDGLLLAGANEALMNLRLSVMGQVVPITQRMTTDIARSK